MRSTLAIAGKGGDCRVRVLELNPLSEIQIVGCYKLVLKFELSGK